MYSKTTLTQTGNALSLEMKGLLDAALTASGKYTKVTNAYVSGTKTFDVWLNDGTTDGYEWYLIVCTDTAATGRLYMGGCLEYSDATKIAKKAMRGGTTAGFVDSSGYPLVSAGGAEMTFALGSFAATTGNTVGALTSSSSPTAAASGYILRVMVTGQVAWVWWGTATTPVMAYGVGTYQKLHGSAQDPKPLAFLCGSSGAGGSVWQNPLASGSGARDTVPGTNGIIQAGTYAWVECLSQPIGKVGAGADMNYDGLFMGSRIHVVRETMTTGGVAGGTNYSTIGWSVGLAPADFLGFARVSGCAIGDTLTVDGKTYESVSNPANTAGLFINTNA